MNGTIAFRAAHRYVRNRADSGQSQEWSLRAELEADVEWLWSCPSWARAWPLGVPGGPYHRPYVHLGGELYAPRTHHPHASAMFIRPPQVGHPPRDPQRAATAAFRMDIRGETAVAIARDLHLGKMTHLNYDARSAYKYFGTGRAWLYAQGAFPWALAPPHGELPPDWRDRPEYASALHGWLWLGAPLIPRWSEDPALAGIDL